MQRIKTADGTILSCLGYMSLPIEFNLTLKVIKFYVVPKITTPVIFGIDFWHSFNLNKNIISLGISQNDLNRNEYINSISNNVGLENYNNLTIQQKSILNTIIEKFNQINTEKVGLGRTNLVQHKIDTGDHAPIKQRYYPLSPIKQKALEDELDRMLKLGVVSPSQSPWNSPVVMVEKANGELRLCLDSRKLNAVSKPDAYPLPYINQILDHLNNAKFLTSIDLSAAFWQIPYDSSSSAEKTAFTVPRRGLFQFNVMCFGLVGASASMQRLMDRLFGPEFDNKVFCFQDDIIIVSSTFEEHVDLLNKVYQRLRDAGLTINMKKSQFCREELKYLGYLVDKHGLRTDPGKVEVILNYPTPTTAKEVKRFLGMSGWYRRFINNFSKITRPLNKLTRKNIEFVWDSEAEHSFNQLKSALVSAPILKMPDYSLPFTILSDASAYSVAAVLTQTHDGVEHPIAYCSRTLNKNEVNYSTTERELLAVIFALEQFRQYVEGQECTVVTDHASLLWFYKLKNPTGRLARWSMRLSQFNFKITHRHGKEMALPDALSRIKIELIEHNSIKDPWYLHLIKSVENNPKNYPNFTLDNGKLYRLSKNKYNLTSEFNWKLVIPEEDRLEILKKCHDHPTSAHLGILKTHKRIALHYFWPRLFQSVKDYVSKCETCKEYKPVNTARPGLMGNPKIVGKPFEAISCDLLGPFPVSRNRNVHLIVVSDYFSKYVLLQPIRLATGMAIARFIEKNVFLVHGVCKTIFMDNGPQFISAHFRQLLTKYNVPNIYYNPRYHPQTNQAERAIRNVVHAISCYVKNEHKKWDEHLVELQCALNTSVNESTKFTPYFLVHGREHIIDGSLYNVSDPPCPREQIAIQDAQPFSTKLNELNIIFQKVRKHLLVAHQRNEKYYNLRKRNAEFKVGQIVYKRTYYLSNKAKNFTSKLAPKFKKCIITAKLSPLVYTLADLEGKCLGNYHIKDILKFDNNNDISA
ncbi:RNase H-like domain-containing protein [Pectobacterium brasiliense]|uniref:RNase H-like domain-containing protein n=1 Tax=Pectobacterium brasiliense TaxID=180957 RepID=UPI00300E40F4